MMQLESPMKKIVKFKFGYCPCCEKYTIFTASGYWFREKYVCNRCRSNPRQRAIMVMLKKLCENWEDLHIHESSPSGATFERIKRTCTNYTYSYFYPEKKLGQFLDDERRITNQNLQELTFSNDVFDLFITQDVLEHVNEPQKALKEIYRCLKPGGMHIFTVPAKPFKETTPRIKIENGKVVPIMEEQYHGNPISEKGSLVTYDWGGDVVRIKDSLTGFKTEVVNFWRSKENNHMGLEADCLQVFISTKPQKVIS